MKSNYEFFNSELGMQVHCPRHFVTVLPDPGRPYKFSKWEKRRDAIIYKWKKRKAIFNIVAQWLIIIPLCGISFVLLVQLLVNAPEQGAVVGFDISLSWLVIYIIISSMFEKDPYWIKVRHRGRTY